MEKSFENFIKNKKIDINEIWKEIEGTLGTYQISSYGRVAHWTQKNKWNILKKTNKNGDYLSVVLSVNGAQKTIRIHRLVAKAFIPNPNNFGLVNHKDGNKQNNYFYNLEWCTQKENVAHAKRIGLWKYNHPYKCTPICQYDLQGSFIAKYRNAKEAERITGVCSRNILQVASKEEYNKKKHLFRKQAGGFVWMFCKGGDV